MSAYEISPTPSNKPIMSPAFSWGVGLSVSTRNYYNDKPAHPPISPASPTKCGNRERGLLGTREQETPPVPVWGGLVGLLGLLRCVK